MTVDNINHQRIAAYRIVLKGKNPPFTTYSQSKLASERKNKDPMQVAPSRNCSHGRLCRKSKKHLIGLLTVSVSFVCHLLCEDRHGHTRQGRS